MRITDKYVFFWSGIYSQWYLIDMVDPESGITFNCSEQYMMWKKAMLFGDKAQAVKVLAEPDPRKQKELGRGVKGFIGEIWDKKKYEIVCNATMLKFTQNPKLLAELLLTGDRTLVEASPKDTIWGIGMGENDRGVEDESNWKGENLLGYACGSTRDFISQLLLAPNNLFIILNSNGNSL